MQKRQLIDAQQDEPSTKRQRVAPESPLFDETPLSFSDFEDDDVEPLDMDDFFAELMQEGDLLDIPLEDSDQTDDSDSTVQEDSYRERQVDPSDRRYITEDGYILPSLYRQNHLNVIRAQMGCGKTEAALAFSQQLKEKLQKDELRILIVVPRKSLATVLAEKFGCVDYQKVSTRIYKGDTSYVVCVNSLHRISKYIGRFNLIILDELSGTIGNVFSSLMEFSLRTSTLANLHYLINPHKYDRNMFAEGKTVLAMDASMGPREVNFLQTVAPECYYQRAYYRPQSLKPLPRVVFEPSIFNFLHDIAYHILCTNEKIVVATCAKEYAGIIMKLLSICSDQFLSDLRIDSRLIIRPRPRFCYFDADTVKDKIEAHLADQDLFKQYDVFVYSPVFVSGISITVKHFDRLYALAQYGTLNAEDFIQMLARIRNLNKNQIMIGCSGKRVPQKDSQLDLVHIDEAIDALNEQTSEYREDMLASLGITKHSPFRHGRMYGSKGRYQTAIEEYFKDQTERYQRNLMCHTVQMHLRTRSNMYESVASAMLLNHPEWALELSRKDDCRSASFDKEALCAILLTHITELGDIKSIRTEEFLVIDTESFETKCTKYSILAGASKEDDTLWKFKDDMLQSSFACIVPHAINNFLMYFSPFSVWYSLIISHCSYGDSRQFDEEMAKLNLFSRLFQAMGWTDHYLKLPIEDSSSSFCIFDAEKLNNIKVNTLEIVRHWTPLLEWANMFRTSLALMGCSAPENRGDGLITYKDITCAKQCIIRLLGFCGIYFVDQTEFIVGKDGKQKRIKRRTLNSVTAEISHLCARDYSTNIPSNSLDKDYGTIHLPCYAYRVDWELFWRSMDVSLRRGFNLHFGDDTTSILEDNMRCLGIIYEKTRQNVVSDIPDRVKDVFQEVFRLMFDAAAKMRDVPSFWVLGNEDQRNHSWNLLRECYNKFSKGMRDLAKTFFIEACCEFAQLEQEQSSQLTEYREVEEQTVD